MTINTNKKQNEEKSFQKNETQLFAANHFFTIIELEI